MHILKRLKIQLKSAVETEAGGPSENTFYKVWNENQRKQYINEHPQSKFAQKDRNQKVEPKSEWEILKDTPEKMHPLYRTAYENQRKQYINDHPNSKFAQEKTGGNKPSRTNPHTINDSTTKDSFSKEYKDSYNTYKKSYEKYHDPDSSDDLHDAIFESFLIDLDDQSGCDTSDADFKDINDLFHKKISLDEFVKKYGGNKASDSNKGELGAILDHFNQNLEI